jgi:hypothetical protein
MNKNITALAATPVFLLVESAAMFWTIPIARFWNCITHWQIHRSRVGCRGRKLDNGGMHSCIPTPSYKCVFQVELGCGKWGL